jgi:hypothetical protein
MVWAKLGFFQFRKKKSLTVGISGLVHVFRDIPVLVKLQDSPYFLSWSMQTYISKHSIIAQVSSKPERRGFKEFCLYISLSFAEYGNFS